MCSLLQFLNKTLLVGLVILMHVLHFCHALRESPMQCNVSLTEYCPAFLYYEPKKTTTLEEAASLFHVNASSVNKTIHGFLISVNCSCPADHDEFTWHIDYTVQPGDTWESVSLKFGSLVVEKPDKALMPSLTVILDLYCGCSGSGNVITYKVKKGDTLFTICSQFKADINNTTTLNKLEKASLIYAGDILFIPEPAGFGNLTLVDDEEKEVKTKKATGTCIVVGAISAAFASVVVAVGVAFWINHKRKEAQQSQQPKHFSQKMDCLPYSHSASPHHTKLEESIVLSLNSNKAVIFPYYEVRDATSNFSIHLKIGQGSYGSVYLGKLRGTDVAIKQMRNTKAKEFLSELNILCRVHHTNLIELIGYAIGGNSLFLVYEFAQNGALSDHLHKSALRGYRPLPWTTRVQIALDAAKGLEYIHEHTKPFYVHRDVKTSNILLDHNFRAKIADFGLVKLLEQSPDVGVAAASRIVGTFGYLAPEYARDGCVTTKSDIYSFGVVLMEFITGQPALSNMGPEKGESFEHRSVVQYMLSALDNKEPSTHLTRCIDPNLTCYHKESLFQMALLSKACVDDNWIQRPDMSRVVVCLSNILMSSKEWEEQERNHHTAHKKTIQL